MHFGRARAARRRRRCRDATLATGRTDRERDRLELQASSKLTERLFLNFVKPVPRDAAAAAAQRLADLCALRVVRCGREQQAKEAEAAAKEAEHQQVANAQGRAFCKHAGAGSVEVALL